MWFFSRIMASKKASGNLSTTLDQGNSFNPLESDVVRLTGEYFSTSLNHRMRKTSQEWDNKGQQMANITKRKYANHVNM